MKQFDLVEKLRELGLVVVNSACGGITVGAGYDCDAPIVPGVNQRLLLGNSDDIESVSFNVTNTTIIEDITMKSTKQCFAFQGVRQSLRPQYELSTGTVSVGYIHTVNFLIFEITQAQKDNIEAMALGKLFAVVENKNSVGNGNSVFEVYGLNVGLEASTAIRIAADQESGGAFSLTLVTPDAEGKEPKMPQSWWVTDYATTAALVEALLTPAV